MNRLFKPLSVVTSVMPSFSLFLILFIGSLCHVVSAEGVRSSIHSGVIAGELLIKFSDYSNHQRRSKIRSKAAARVKSEFNSFGVEHWKLTGDRSLAQTIESLQQNPDVEFVEPNYRRFPRIVIPSDPRYIDQKNRLEQIQLPLAWEQVYGKGLNARDVTIAIIDDGFDINHPDLILNVDLNTSQDFVGQDNDPSPEYCNGDVNDPETHGTTVAGVAGAFGGNGEGIVGSVWDARLMLLRIGCNYSVAEELQAMQWAVSMGANIVNISYGGPQYSEAERTAIFELQDRDILLVAAAGNIDVNNDKVPDYPSGLDLPNILAVAAVDANDKLASWSQYGPTSVDIAAPGVDILTTVSSLHYSPNCDAATTGVKYCAVDGTSYSAPLVSGVAALLKARFPDASFRDLKGAIMASVVTLPGVKGRLATDGRIDANQAFFAMNNPQPVIVIKEIEIDDSSSVSGNDNGVLDIGEVLSLHLTLENVWKDIHNLRVELHSTVLNENAYNPQQYNIGTLLSGESKQISLIIRVDNYINHTRIPFDLFIEGTDENRVPYSVVRNFELEIGDLDNGRAVVGTLRQSGDLQDDFHYFHIDVESNAVDLTIDLKVINSETGTGELDMLVRYQSPPLFDYFLYDQANDGVNEGTLVAAEPGLKERVVIPSPRKGTYHIVVFPPVESKKPDIKYILMASYRHQHVVEPAGGCSLRRASSLFDPVLVLLALFGFVGILRRNQKFIR